MRSSGCVATWRPGSREYRPKDDLSALDKAFRFARQWHEGQMRDSGEPYMVHPATVALILADMRMDLVAIQTGLLHDVVEDTSVTVDQVRKEFGKKWRGAWTASPSSPNWISSPPRSARRKSVRKMLLAMVEDIRVILVKLADRLHNMRTLGFLGPERRERIARETAEIYAPIAHRLGMGKVRNELEDLAFQHLEPDACKEIVAAIEAQRHSNDDSWTKSAAPSRRSCGARASRRASRAGSSGRSRSSRKCGGRRSASTRFTT